MDTNIKSEKERTEGSFLERYKGIMHGVCADIIERYSIWEKEGDNYKKYSLYDVNKYEATTSSSIKNK